MSTLSRGRDLLSLAYQKQALNPGMTLPQAFAAVDVDFKAAVVFVSTYNDDRLVTMTPAEIAAADAAAVDAQTAAHIAALQAEKTHWQANANRHPPGLAPGRIADIDAQLAALGA